MTTAIQASLAEQVDDGGGVAWRIFTNSSFTINVDIQANLSGKDCLYLIVVRFLCLVVEDVLITNLIGFQF